MATQESADAQPEQQVPDGNRPNPQQPLPVSNPEPSSPDNENETSSINRNDLLDVLGQDAVRQSKVTFEGGGYIRPIHYNQAVSALRKAQFCIQHLQALLQSAHPALEPLEHEELIVDLRHRSIEIKDAISRLSNYDLANQRQLERNRKDTATRLSRVLVHLDDLSRRIRNKGFM